jgi:hypothetical protein
VPALLLAGGRVSARNRAFGAESQDWSSGTRLSAVGAADQCLLRSLSSRTDPTIVHRMAVHGAHLRGVTDMDGTLAIEVVVQM